MKLRRVDITDDVGKNLTEFLNGHTGTEVPVYSGQYNNAPANLKLPETQNELWIDGEEPQFCFIWADGSLSITMIGGEIGDYFLLATPEKDIKHGEVGESRTEYLDCPYCLSEIVTSGDQRITGGWYYCEVCERLVEAKDLDGNWGDK